MSDNSWHIRPEEGADAAAVEALNAASFGPGRFAKSAWRLREGVGPVPGLSFVAAGGPGPRAEAPGDGGLRGSVRFWPIGVGGRQELLLGPLAVRGSQRGKGIGVALMRAGIEAARQGSWRAILLVGDEPYYAKVGFSRLPPGQVRLPGPVDPSRVLCLALKGGEMLSLTGEIRRAGIDEAVCADSCAVG